MATTEYKKLTINLAADLADELQAMADEEGVTLSEMFRRAIAVYKMKGWKR